jgi:hypothetical protein
LGSSVKIATQSEEMVADADFGGNARIDREEAVDFQNVTIRHTLFIKGDNDVYILNSEFQGGAKIVLESDESTLPNTDSTFARLEINGDAG